MEITAYINRKDNVQSFEQSYKSVNGILYLFSFLGNLASIVCAYFFLYIVLMNVTDPFWGKPIVIGIITVLALAAFELLKRFLFKQTAILFLTGRERFEKISIGILAGLIICTSFYLSISGAHTMSDKSKNIVTDNSKKINSVIAGIESAYTIKIATQQKQIESYTQLILTGTKSRALRAEYNGMIRDVNNIIEKLNLQKASEIKAATAELNKGADLQLKESDSNVNKFLFLSTFIEMIILIGVGFDAYYNYRVYTDFDFRVSGSRKLQRYVRYSRLLDTVYNSGKTGKGEILVTGCTLSKIAKSLDIAVDTKQVNDFYNLLVHLKVAKNVTRSKVETIALYSEAKTALKDYFKI